MNNLCPKHDLVTGSQCAGPWLCSCGKRVECTQRCEKCKRYKDMEEGEQ